MDIRDTIKATNTAIATVDLVKDYLTYLEIVASVVFAPSASSFPEIFFSFMISLSLCAKFPSVNFFPPSYRALFRSVTFLLYFTASWGADNRCFCRKMKVL